MASIHKEATIRVPAQELWDAARDAGGLHTRLVKGFVTDCKLEGDARTVTFGNGLTVRELIVDVDDTRRRIAWTAVGGRLSHHNASLQVFESGPGECRAVWTADLLPHEMAPAIAAMIDQGLAAMRLTLENQVHAI
ncbi:SRPBCC family protein [Piscinibacter terrae]|uniref:SRPBCC family protein n=1 Tax=Piscinibacter terrae TaxID=2496871 RepID=A0A3N7HUQ3_9BURK|nr:SRPBCC family protein [Albitalea terrae]RQP25046.1 SRPBCC family protein [Albitalea terrae]